MGGTMSMDVSASCINDASYSPLLLPMLTPTPHLHEPSSFEDKLRLESLLIPEDLVDIHIEASAATNTSGSADATDATEATEATDTLENQSKYGKGKHWKRNMKKKQHTSSLLVPTPTERTLEQRREQVRPIIDKLTELQMNISYPAIRELYKQLNHFVKTGEDAKIKIPFPEFSRKIKGELSNAPYIPCWVKLEMD
jgi:hypothetical protein